MRPSASNDPPQDAPRDRTSSDASTARALRASAIALSSANASERAAAAESLLELDIGAEARGAADGARFGRRGRREEAGEGEEKTKGEL